MCGFLAEFCYNKHQVTDANTFNTLLQLSKNRGPDDTQNKIKEYYQLGFNRLAILDLSSNGAQPMFSPTNRYVITFNGELYNFKSLAKSHALQNLKSTSDTEVLVHLLETLGVEETLKQLDGMFALAVVDTLEQKTYVARDFAGIKPLFYGLSPKGFVAASQFNQVFKHPWFKATLMLRPEIMKSYFQFGYMQSPNTVFENVFQVNPGELVCTDRYGHITKKYFKTFNFNPPLKTEQPSKFILDEAVAEQLVSDVSLGVFLSGGVDSPLISAMASHQKPDLEAYTFKSRNKDLDESQAAKAYAEKLGIKHYVLSVELSNVKGIVDAHFKNLSEPFGDYSSIPTYLITKQAKSHKTVMLSGDGGDELFFGYPRFQHIYRHRHWFKIPYNIRRILARISIKCGFLNTWGPYTYKSIGAWVKSKHSYIKQDVADQLIPNSFIDTTMEELYEYKGTKGNTLLSWLRRNEFYGHLQRVLIKVDRMSMANSLEVRVPFLSSKVVDNALKYLPAKFQSQSDLKFPLKLWLADEVNKDLVSDNKKGFAIPIGMWLKSGLSNDVKECLIDSPVYGSEYIDKSFLESYVNEFYDQKHDNDWGIWHLYAWQKWAINEGLI